MEKCFHPNSKCFTVIGKKRGLYYQERHCTDCKRIVGSMRDIKGSKTYIEEMKSLFPDIKFVSKKRILN